MSEGICPNCRGDQNAIPEMVAKVVRPTTEFPAFCHRCCIPTNSYAKISGQDTSHAPRGSSDSEFPIALLVKLVTLPFVVIASLLFGPFGLLMSAIVAVAIFLLKGSSTKSKQQEFYVRVKVPTCAGCKKLGIAPIEICWEEDAMRIAMDPEFAKRME